MPKPKNIKLKNLEVFKAFGINPEYLGAARRNRVDQLISLFLDNINMDKPQYQWNRGETTMETIKEEVFFFLENTKNMDDTRIKNYFNSLKRQSDPSRRFRGTAGDLGRRGRKFVHSFKENSKFLEETGREGFGHTNLYFGRKATKARNRTLARKAFKELLNHYRNNG